MIILKFLEVQILYAALFPSVGWSVGRTGIIFKKKAGPSYRSYTFAIYFVALPLQLLF